MPTGFKVKQQGNDGNWVNQSALSLANWSGQQPNAVIYANGKYVAVGNSGRVADSPDGINWTIRPQLQTTSWSTKNISDIAYGNGIYVIGDANSAYTATSTDAVTWTVSGVLPGMWTTGNGVSALGFGNGKFIVTGFDFNKKAYSTDGVNWTNGSGSFSGYALNIIYDSTNSRYVASCSNGYITTSTDGINWTTNTGLNSATSYWLNRTPYTVKYLNGIFIAGGSGAAIATSTDGVNWTYRPGLGNATTYEVYSIEWDGTAFWEVGGNTTKLFATTDTTSFATWTSYESVLRGDSGATSGVGGTGMVSIVYGNGIYVVNGQGRSSSTTTPTTFWTKFGSVNLPQMSMGVYGADKFVFVGSSGSCYTSTDGLSWTSQASLATAVSSNSMTCINWNGSKYIAGGANGKIATSTDGVTWTNQAGLASTSWGTTTVNGICWSGSQYVAGGNNGQIATSSDGVTWTYQGGLASTTWGTASVTSVAYGAGKFVAVGPGGIFAYSSDGVTWTDNSTANGLTSTFGLYNANSIIWDSVNSRYVVVGDSGRLSTSSNSTTWTYQTGFNSVWGSTYNASSIVRDGTRYIVAGGNGQIATSTDAATWTNQTGLSSTAWGTTATTTMATNGSGSTIVLGATGQTATTTNGSTWTNQTGLANAGWVAGGWAQGSNYNGSQYLLVGDNASIARSYDGINWTCDSNLKSTAWGTTDIINCVAWTGTQYVIGGPAGKIATSPDGITWTYQGGLASTAWNSQGNCDVLSMTYNGSVLLVTGGGYGGSRVSISTDKGVTWTTTLLNTQGLNQSFSASCWNGTKFLVAGGYVYQSSDGINWTYNGGAPTGAEGLVWFKNKFVLTGALNAAAYSYDGATWFGGSINTIPSHYGSQTWKAIYIDGERLVTVGKGQGTGSGIGGNSSITYDGINWVIGKRFSPDLWCNTVTGNGDYYLAAGYNGAVSLGRNNYQVDLDDLLVRRDAFSSGNLLTWGYGLSGALGTGNTSNYNSPRAVVGTATNWKQVSTGDVGGQGSSIGLKSDGSVWGWGYNLYGQLGTGDTTASYSPVSSAATVDKNWKQIFSCGYSTFGIKTDGTLLGWGYNGKGQLGDGSTTNRSSPVTVAGGGTWKQVSAGGMAQVAGIKIDGTLWTWGVNTNGQLGDGTTTSKSSPATTAGGGTNWKQVSAGGSHIAAIKTDGTLWTCGYNSYGQLGDGTTTNRSSLTSVVGGGTNWKQVAAGGNHTVAIKSDGSLWGWGLNNSGQLGTGNVTNRSSPVSMLGGSNWKYVTAAAASSSMIKTDGTLWVCGYNSFNVALGTGTSSNYSSPVMTTYTGNNWKSISSSAYRQIGVLDSSV